MEFMAKSFEKLQEIVTETAVAAGKVGITTDELGGRQEETRRYHQETERVLRETMKELSDNDGNVDRRLGEIVEAAVLPGLMKKMYRLKHNFTIASPQKKFSKDGEMFAEISLVLENCDEVMAVETKARFKLGDIDDFLRSIELLRENENITDTAGKVIYAAVAAIGFDKPARRLAQKSGMYLIDIDQDNDRIKVIPPSKGKVGKW
jgi:hypothetical protein